MAIFAGVDEYVVKLTNIGQQVSAACIFLPSFDVFLLNMEVELNLHLSLGLSYLPKTVSISVRLTGGFGNFNPYLGVLAKY